MLEIPWQKYSSKEERYVFHIYLFKKRQLFGREIYEIWKNGELFINELTYFEFLKKAAEVMDRYKRYGY